MNLFRESKYTKWYFQIIEKAKVSSIGGYTENHHIIPKSLGGINDKENIVKLSAKAHYVCHLLLVKMVSKPKHIRSMMYALVRFKTTHSKNKRFTGATYQYLKEKFSKQMSGENNPFYGKGHLISGQKNPFFGKHHTQKVKDLISKSSKRFCGENNPFYGKHHSKEAREKLSKCRKDSKRSSGPYMLISPEGEKYFVTEGIKSFCEEHQLTMCCVINAARKNQKTKGWTIKYASN